MPLKSNMSEEEVLKYIFNENSNLEDYKQERHKNLYHTFKFHLPSEMYKTDNLKFSFNKGLTNVSAFYGELLLYKIPNSEEEKFTILCPADKDFVTSINLPDNKRSSLVKKLKYYRKPYIEIEMDSEIIINFTSEHWKTLSNLYSSLV